MSVHNDMDYHTVNNGSFMVKFSIANYVYVPHFHFPNLSL